MTVATIEYIIGKAKSKKEVVERLDDAEVVYKDLTSEYGYFNLRVPVKDGYIRIYEKNGKYIVDKFTRAEIKASGVPTFEPSGRRSF